VTKGPSFELLYNPIVDWMTNGNYISHCGPVTNYLLGLPLAEYEAWLLPGADRNAIDDKCKCAEHAYRGVPLYMAERYA
jgi:hypothetical protein